MWCEIMEGETMKITFNKEEIDEILTDAIIKKLNLNNFEIGARHFFDDDGRDIDIVQRVCGYTAEVKEVKK